MPNHNRTRQSLAALLLVFAVGALPTGAQDQKEEVAGVVSLLTDLVIPAADKDFATLKGNKVAGGYISDPSWYTTLRLPKNWGSTIVERLGRVEFTIYFRNQTHKDPLWIYSENGGAWLAPLYESIRAALSDALKSGWKRKSVEDRNYGPEDDTTGSQTRWTRRDGLTVLLWRLELWSRDVLFNKKLQRDPKYLTLDLTISVIKSK